LLVNATDDVARQVRTGQKTSLTQTELKNMICTRIQLLVSTGCPGLRVDLRTYASFQAAANQVVYVLPNDVVALEMNGSTGKALVSQVGGSGAKQTLRTFYYWPLLTNLMSSTMSTGSTNKALLSASQTWQNEAY